MGNKTHHAAILIQVLLWIGGVVAAVAALYVFVLSDIKEAEIRAVALTVLSVAGFMLVRLPFAVLRGLLAAYVVVPLMGGRASNRAGLARQFYRQWRLMLRDVGWDSRLSERPAYERIAEEIRDALRKIEGKLERPQRPGGVDEIEIADRRIAFDVGEDFIRGRIVILDTFQDERLLDRLAAGARSESVRIGARRRLIEIQTCGDDAEALREHVARAYRN